MISIHAPHAGSDAQECFDWWLRLNISIHAPHAGSDQNTDLIALIDRDFNPRPPRGERPEGYGVILTIFGISIHAPTRGATLICSLATEILRYFNPRPHAGSDLMYMLDMHKWYEIQSTPPRGERPKSYSTD